MNVLRESYRHFKQYTHIWITCLVLMSFGVLTSVLIPQVSALIIDRVINPVLGNEVQDVPNFFAFVIKDFAPDDYIRIFTALLALFAGLLLVRYLQHFFKWYMGHFYGVEAEKTLRKKVFLKMLNQNSIVMSRYTSGDLMSICNGDINQVKDLWALNLFMFFDLVLAVIFSTFFLSRIYWMLVFVPIGLGITAFIIMVFYIKSLRRCYNNIRQASADLNSCVQENINGVRIIRSFASENIEINKFSKRNGGYRDNFITHAKIVARYQTIFNTLGQIINISSITFGVMLALNGVMTPGQFATFVTYIALIYNPLVQIANFVGVMQNAVICGKRMLTFLNTENIITDPENPLEISEKPSLAMRNVSIKLDESEEELKNVTIDIPYGKKLGIMGKTGAGKSVMIKAFTRLFEAAEGETLINGENIKKYRVDDVRRQFSYVMQEVFLFSDTVDGNIAAYDPEIPHEKVELAAKCAEAHNFILRLEKGYDTVIGEKGVGLSGGQKQRISIARALIKDAPIILLDDCTSALDMETEHKILDNISKNYSGKTLIIASHRASSVINCDEIIFLENGEIRERGTHDSLIEQKGSYYEVYSAQAAAAREGLY